MIDEVTFHIRDAIAPDLGFIIDTWLKSYWDAPAVRGMTRDDYYAVFKPRVREILARPNVTVRVMCPDGDDDTVIGWAALEDVCLHYVFVRREFRHNGFARQLVGDNAMVFSFRSKSIVDMPPGLRYWPHLGSM